jgi:superfamily II DNA or RNA helicase
MSMNTGLVRVPKSELGLMARELIKKELTVFPVSTTSFNLTPEPIRLWREDQTHIYVPRGYFWENMRRFDPSWEFGFSEGACELPPVTPITPREGQEAVIAAAVESLQRYPFGGVIIEAQVGAGKTVLSLEAARRLGRKILVVVHTSVLMDQWIGEIKRFFPEWSVGKIRGETIDTENNQICVGMLQSLSMKDDYPEWLYREFGTIICDEIHVCGSAEFKNVLFKFALKYFIGVSGTLNRADRAENVFKFGLGPVVKGQKIKSLVPTIYFVDTKYVGKGINIKDYSRDKHKMLADICSSPARNTLIVNNAVKAALAGRHVLVLSERVAHVEELYSMIREQLDSAFIKVGKMVGSSKKEVRDYAQDAQVLIATSQLLAVGFNNPRLDTLIFATPMQSVVQPVGRVIRQHPEKKPPLVIDLVETSSKGARILAKSRAKKYREKGWTLKHTHLLDDPPPSFKGGKTW